MIVNVKGDGDCLYRALAIGLGFEEEQRLTVKELMADYIQEASQVFDYLGNVQKISREIRKPKHAARFEFIKIAAECF